MRAHFASITLSVVALATSLSSCTLFLAANVPCDVDADCEDFETCKRGFCLEGVGGGEGEGEEGEGEEGEGEEGEGEEGEGEEGEGEEGEGEEGEGEEGEGEGEGEEGEGEGGPPETIIICGTEHIVPEWFDATFPFRVPLAFCDLGAPNEAVVGLPVTVVLDVLSFPELAAIAADGRDVLFVDHKTGVGEALPYDRQLYTDNAQAVFHVRVPSMNPSTGADDMWLYFGSADGVERNDPLDAYADYASVWHFDTAAALLRDAKSGTPTTNDGADFVTAGVLAGGIQTDGGEKASLLNAAPPPARPVSPQGAISIFLAPNANQDLGHVVFMSDAGGGDDGGGNGSIHLSIVDDELAFYVPSNLPTDEFTLIGPTVLSEAYRHYSASWGGTTVSLTADGLPAATTTATVQATFIVASLTFGLAEGGDGDYDGEADELRISNIPRPDSFFRAEKLAYTNALLEFGVVELLTP